ncbi:threonine/serine exporter ThrE family protein [Vibrio cholerae]|nr:threonine/serine exporter ThrE family protein [Vibrio cholerae]EGR2423670.1 threonine/serine exporter ThrE family protein [Vibrio cholerae]EGR3978148.1 threonine/serine exporter ThrE family protein [Vibrio cholerae]
MPQLSCGFFVSKSTFLKFVSGTLTLSSAYLGFRKGIMESKQRAVSRLIAQAGQMLLAHGAESTLVGDIMRRMGLASGMSEVEVSLSASSLVVTTVYKEHCITTARRSPDRGINMRVVTQIQRICIMMEKGILDHSLAQRKLNYISPERYNRWLVVVMIGLSCAAFSRLAGGDWMVFLITLIASSVGMIVRQEIGHRQFNPLINFAATAFVTSVISAQAVIYQLGNKPTIVMASSVLMLVPGFPLINAVADMLKGYINMGIARFVMASLLTLATALGIVAAMSITGIWGW